MNKTSAINYIIPRQPYLWRWADGYSAVEWDDDTTVCLWMELQAFLNYLAPSGLPPVGSILLVLMACHQKATVAYETATMFSGSISGGDTPSTPSKKLLSRLKKVLESVQALPEDLRTGLSARAHLLKTLFEDVNNRQPPGVSELILSQIDIHGLDGLGRELPSLNAGARLLRDLKAIATVYESRQLRELESLLRAGIEFVKIEAAPVPEPTPEPGEASMPLLRQMEEHPDVELAMIAATTRRMVAMFTVPRASGYPQALPVGGISDITNRGTYDRLLPGELAYDDLILTARLANNEALFFRRENPPDEPASERIILLDSGIHLWGAPRVFAIAAALGLQANAAVGEKVRLFHREGRKFLPLSLDSIPNVRSCLYNLPPHPDPEEAISAFTLDEDSPRRPDVFLISVAQDREPILQALHELTHKIAQAGGRFYKLTVSRTGALELGMRSTNGTRILAVGRIDPDTIVKSSPPTTPDKPVKRAADLLINLPELIKHLAFYQQRPLPFRFPVVSQSRNVLMQRMVERYEVSADGRLVHWDNEHLGAIEIASDIPKARDYYINLHAGEIIVVASAHKPGAMVQMVCIDQTQGLRRDHVVPARHAFPLAAKVLHGAVILTYSDLVEAFSIEDGSKLHSIKNHRTVSIHDVNFDGQKLSVATTTDTPSPPALPKLKVSELPALMSAPLSVGFDSAGNLVIHAREGRWQLALPPLIWQPTKQVLLSAVQSFLPLNPQEPNASPDTPRYYQAKWNEDCRLIFDSRGVLHIVFHDQLGDSEIALLCLLEKPTAVWVRDWPTHYFGNPDWISLRNPNTTPATWLAPLMTRFSSVARRSWSTAIKPKNLPRASA